MKKRYSFILACLVSTIAVADNYTTGGDGTTYSLEKLASVQGSGVSKDGSVYTLADSLTIADGDKFVLDGGVTLKMADKVTFQIYGDADFAVANPTTITRESASVKPGQVEFRKDNSTVNIKNVNWDYVGMKIYGTPTNLNIDSCRFEHYVYVNKVSGPIGVAAPGSKINITNTRFANSEYSSVSGAANMLVSYRVENCEFYKSQQTNRNYPMLNLQQGDSIIVRNNVFVGDSTKDLVGAISVGNMLSMDADLYVLIEGNTVDSCRYGINIQGKFNNAIIRNNTLRHNKYVYKNNANNGGSGIAIYDASKNLNLKVSGNIIEDNLWGITIMGGKNINLGKVEVDGQKLSETDPDYNEGKNIFRNNGNNGKIYDLGFASGTSYLTVYAQNNVWTPQTMTAESIEDVVLHQKDDSQLGLAIFTPWFQGETSAVVKPQVSTGSAKAEAIYSVDGQRLSQLRHGLNIVRMTDGSTRKVLVK